MFVTSDDLLGTIRSQLTTSVIGDVLDTLGLTHQFLPPTLRPLDPTHVLAGYAFPVLEADCASDMLGDAEQPAAFGRMFEALDSLAKDEIYICTGSSAPYALWGELMSLKAIELGAAGAVVDGFHRDTHGIRKLNFPIFSVGPYAQDQRMRGRVIDFRCPLEFANGTRVNNRDILVGDVDGIVIVPKARVAEVIDLALKKLDGEAQVRAMIKGGQGTAEIFAKTGIM